MRKLLLPVLAAAIASFAMPAMAGGCSYSTSKDTQATDGQTS